MAAHMEGQPSVPDLIRRLGPAVEVLHLNDNEGKTDMHAIPFVRSHPRTGALNWQEVFRALDEIGYNGYYNLEMGWNTYGFNFSTEEAIFGVKVLSVNTINVPGKATRGRTGRYGYTSDWKKAIIRLTEDSKTIELFEGMV